MSIELSAARKRWERSVERAAEDRKRFKDSRASFIAGLVEWSAVQGHAYRYAVAADAERVDREAYEEAVLHEYDAVAHGELTPEGRANCDLAVEQFNEWARERGV